MNTKRIQEIQQETAHPDSLSVQQALLKVWNECARDNENNTIFKFANEYEEAEQSFTEWWDRQIHNSNQWATIERIAAHDAWREAWRIKSNQEQNVLFKFFDELKSEWEPKTGISEQFAPNHGSSTGEFETKKVYWDEYRSNWTSHKPTAFEGFVLKRIRRLFNEWVRNKKNNTEA